MPCACHVRALCMACVLQVNYSLDGGKTFVNVASIADDASPSGTLYTLTWNTATSLPPNTQAILQTVYKVQWPSSRCLSSQGARQAAPAVYVALRCGG